jgi:hypothetical protein
MTRHGDERSGIEAAQQRFTDRAVALGQLDRGVPERRRPHLGERAFVIANLEVGKLEAARRRDHDRALVLRDLAARRELLKRCERDALTLSTTPSNALSARTALEKLTGLPIWIAEASVVFALTGASSAQFAR